MTGIPLTPALAAKVLCGLAVASATCCGGYYAYNHSPSNDYISSSGFLWSVINESPGKNLILGKTREETLGIIGGDWRCSKHLFDNFEIPKAYGPDRDKTKDWYRGEFQAMDPISEDELKGESIGCLVADLRHSIDDSKGSFIQWELALQNNNRGFIYLGFLGSGSIKIEEEYSSEEKYWANSSASMVFEMSKNSGKWEIENGFIWSDAFTHHARIGNNKKILINLPEGKYEWESGKDVCTKERCNFEKWTQKSWTGFWVQSSKGEQQPTDALDIKIEQERKDISERHDIWKYPDFDFGNSNQTNDVTKNSWKEKVEAWYGGRRKKWKELVMSNAEPHLKEIYKPWARRKGIWIKASDACSETNEKRPSGEEALKLSKLCYKKQPSA